MRPLQNPVIPLKAGASAHGTSIQNQQKPRHSRGRGNPESIKHAFSPNPGDNHSRSRDNHRHSRGRGNPESTKHAFSPNPGDNHSPFRSQGMYESLTRNHWQSATRVLQWSPPWERVRACPGLDPGVRGNRGRGGPPTKPPHPSHPSKSFASQFTLDTLTTSVVQQ